jgi:hypothetical protein
MVDLAKHASHIATQLKFLATDTAAGNRLEETDTIAALAQSAGALRSAAAVFEREKRQRGTEVRTERLWSDIPKSGTLDADALECCCAVCRSQDR